MTKTLEEIKQDIESLVNKGELSTEDLVQLSHFMAEQKYVIQARYAEELADLQVANDSALEKFVDKTTWSMEE